jgi:hypothetical protein
LLETLVFNLNSIQGNYPITFGIVFIRGYRIFEAFIGLSASLASGLFEALKTLSFH